VKNHTAWVTQEPVSDFFTGFLCNCSHKSLTFCFIKIYCSLRGTSVTLARGELPAWSVNYTDREWRIASPDRHDKNSPRTLSPRGLHRLSPVARWASPPHNTSTFIAPHTPHDEPSARRNRTARVTSTTRHHTAYRLLQDCAHTQVYKHKIQACRQHAETHARLSSFFETQHHGKTKRTTIDDKYPITKNWYFVIVCLYSAWAI